MHQNRGCLPVFCHDVAGFGFILPVQERNKYGDNTHDHKNDVNAFDVGDITPVWASEKALKCDIFFPALLS